MTEVPDHLLRRSKERRAAIGGGGSEGGEPPATPGEAPGSGAAASAVEPAGGSEVAPAAAAPVPVEEPPKPLPPYVAASTRRPRVPTFAIPVLAALPVWALVYAGTLFQPTAELEPELQLGKSVYESAGCSGCHGASGEGGTGRPLTEVLLTFPDKADHIAWIVDGSPAAGTPYGDPGRPGGQRISQSGGYAAMPAFGDSLSEEEIDAVARYEREVLGGGEAEPSSGEAPAGEESSGAAEEH